MANKKKTKSGGKKKSESNSAPSRASQRNTNSKRANTSVPRSIALTPKVEQICGLNDPFCPTANGAKILDQSSQNTFSFQSKTINTIVSDVSGNAAMLFLPNYYYNWAQSPTTQVDDTCTFSTVMSPNTTAMAGVKDYRIVSAGVTLTGVSAPLDASGMVYVRTFNLNGAGAGTIAGATFNSLEHAEYSLASLSNRSPAVLFSPCGPSTYEWRSQAETTPSSAIADYVSNQTTSVMITVMGAPISRTVLECTLTVNFEVTFYDSASMGSIQSKPPKYNPYMDAVNKEVKSVGQSIFAGGVAAVGTVVKNAAFNALQSLVSKAPLLLL
jgi:hypothetical protein